MLSNNPNAIEILKENIDLIDWNQLSTNINAMQLLKEHQDKINWSYFSANPSIFTYDYEKMQNSNLNLKEEIIASALNPKRIFRLIEKYGEEEIYNNYFDE